MPRFAPTLKARYGATSDTGGNVTHSVAGVVVAVGDVVVVTLNTSDYLHRAQAVPSGLTGATFTERAAVYGISQYANVYTWSAVATQAGTFTLSVPVSGGNAGANFAIMRAMVWGGSEGVGAQASARIAAGTASQPITTQRENSALVYVGVDWNAAAGAGATVTPHSGNTTDMFFNGGAAEYVTAYMASTGAVGAKTAGFSAPTNWKTSNAALEVFGQFRDTQAPTVPTGLTATPESPSSIRLNWTASTDDIGVTGYRITRTSVADGAIAIVADDVVGTTWTNTGLPASSSWTYQVRAKDAAGNMSANTAGVTATTPSANLQKLKRGASDPNLIHCTTQVAAVYLGSTKVWP